MENTDRLLMPAILTDGHLLAEFFSLCDDSGPGHGHLLTTGRWSTCGSCCQPGR